MVEEHLAWVVDHDSALEAQGVAAAASAWEPQVVDFAFGEAAFADQRMVAWVEVGLVTALAVQVVDLASAGEVDHVIASEEEAFGVASVE